MQRRHLVKLLGAAAIWPIHASAQEPGRTYRMGALSFLPRTAPSRVALFEELRRLGFVEDRNLEIDGTGFGLVPEQLAAHAAELVEAKVDVILCAGATAIRAAQQATTTIPILGISNDMVGEGLVRSLARPGGNTTGASLFAVELDGKRQELLIELLPGVRRIAAIVDSRLAAAHRASALQAEARARGIDVDIRGIEAPAEIAPAIADAKSAGAGGLNVLASPMLFSNRHTIFERTAALGLPAIYPFPEAAQEGGLAAYGASLVEVYRHQVSRLLVQILRGIKPGDLPIQQPTKFELVINLKTAKALGLTIPQAILARANEVIE